MPAPDLSPLPPEASSGNQGVCVVVNGETLQMPARTRVNDLLEHLGIAGRPLAVEINREVVPRRHLGDRTLADGDQLEIVTLVGGG